MFLRVDFATSFKPKHAADNSASPNGMSVLKLLDRLIMKMVAMIKSSGGPKMQINTMFILLFVFRDPLIVVPNMSFLSFLLTAKS